MYDILYGLSWDEVTTWLWLSIKSLHWINSWLWIKKKEYFKEDCLLNQTSTSTAPLRSSDCADWAAKGETASGIFEVDLAGKKYTPEIH